MELQLIPSERVTLVAPLQNHGQFGPDEPNFWDTCKGGYKIYLLRKSYVEAYGGYQDLFLVDTSATKCIFKGWLR